jgi:two-component system cell cycle sensor histidine kinase PleC
MFFYFCRSSVIILIGLLVSAAVSWQFLFNGGNKVAGFAASITLLLAAIVLVWRGARNAGPQTQSEAAPECREPGNPYQFLADVSHELRTPLNTIIGFSEFIRSETSGPIGNKVYQEYIHDIYNSSVHLLGVVNDILEYTKADANMLTLDIDQVDAGKSVRGCIRLMAAHAQKAQIRLIEQIPARDFVLATDARKLKQIVLNLVSNAIKFTLPGGAVTVQLDRNAAGDVVLTVIDTGVGIAEADIARALLPFGQVDSLVTRRGEGTGLGLPLTQKFAQALGGTFTLASEVGKGTTITVTLPGASKPGTAA